MEKMSIKLDKSSIIFQTLNGVLDQVEVKYKNQNSYLYNKATGSSPLVIHGNGPIKVGDLPSTASDVVHDPTKVQGRNEVAMSPLFVLAQVQQAGVVLEQCLDPICWLQRLQREQNQRGRGREITDHLHDAHD